MPAERAGGRVRVCYVGMVRRAVGVKEEYVALEGPATLGTLLSGLADRYGVAFRDHVFTGDKLSRASTVLVDGLDCATLGGLDAPLDDTTREIEVVVFGPPLSGG